MLSRLGLLVVTLAAASAGLLVPDVDRLVADLRGSDLPAALVAVGSLVQLALSAWVLTIAVLTCVRAPGPLVRAVAPRVLRRALLASAAGALTLAPAHADPAATPDRSAQHDVAGLRLPDRPVAAVEPVDPDPGPAHTHVVVRPGDTLWSIAARSLPAGAGDAAIARACARWHAANRDVIGPDPDLIFPLQRLVPPLGKDLT